jgi:hypothetical protein
MIRIFNPENTAQTTSLFWSRLKSSEKIPEIKLAPFQVKDLLVK